MLSVATATYPTGNEHQREATTFQDAKRDAEKQFTKKKKGEIDAIVDGREYHLKQIVP